MIDISIPDMLYKPTNITAAGHHLSISDDSRVAFSSQATFHYLKLGPKVASCHDADASKMTS